MSRNEHGTDTDESVAVRIDRAKARASRKGGLPPVSDGSEYSQMRRDVAIYDDRLSSLMRADKALRFSNVKSETSTGTATTFADDAK